MPIDLRNLDNLSETQVRARMLQLESLVEELGVGASVRRGVIRDWVLRLNAIVGQAFSDRMDVVGRSLNPLIPINGLVDSDILSQTAATYGITRRSESIASGQLRIELDRNRTVLVPSGTLFTTADGRQYVTARTFAGRASVTELRDEGDRQLVLNAEGNYEFYIDANATVAGTNGNLLAGEELTFVDTSVTNVVRITAAADFTGGQSRETNEQLIARIRRQLPAKTFSTRLSVAATLTSQDTLPDTLAVSTIGYGDVEMVRAQRMAMDGRSADVYLRPNELPSNNVFILQARCIAAAGDGVAIWCIDIDRDTFPGFYRVVSVRGTTIGELTQVEVSRSYDNSPIEGELSPRLFVAEDAAFSRFQTATIVGRTPAGDYQVGDTTDVEVVLSGMPDIATAQTIASSRRHRFLGGDTLVRAAVPSFVSVGIDLHARRSIVLPSPQLLQQAVASIFNTAGFVGRLHTSRIASTVHAMLNSTTDVAEVSVIVETLLPTGEIHRRVTTDHIDVPNIPSLSATPRTCAFICDPASVIIRAYTETLPNIL